MVVLVVDDEAEACKLLNMILSDMGYQVHIAHNGKDALSILERMQFDIVFLDINMPDKSGIEIIQKLKNEGNKVRIIVVSAVDNEIAKTYIEEFGIDSYIIKPYKIDYLKAEITKAIRKIYC
jgi:two-component system alkaline phosphatase synthesis response regulator PhoP